MSAEEAVHGLHRGLSSTPSDGAAPDGATLPVLRLILEEWMLEWTTGFAVVYRCRVPGFACSIVPTEA